MPCLLLSHWATEKVIATAVGQQGIIIKTPFPLNWASFRKLDWLKLPR
jgi:hypothetical protein